VPHRAATTPGHEVVGRVVAVGRVGRRVGAGAPGGIAWVGKSARRCAHCRRGAENLCPCSTYTGWDADGGYADYATVPADYAYALPEEAPSAELAPLLCGGIVGYRALRRAGL